MAAPLKISRSALQAAAKAAGFQDLRKVSLSQFRALCAAAGANGEVVPAGTGAAGAGAGAAGLGSSIDAPGAAVGAAGLGSSIDAPGAAVGAAGLGSSIDAPGAAVGAAGLGSSIGAPGAGVGAPGLGSSIGAPGAGVGAAIGAPGAGVGAADLGSSIGAPGTKGTGAGLATADLGANGGHWIGAPAVSLYGAKLKGAQGAAAAGLGIGAPGAAGLTGGMRVGAKYTGAKDVAALGALGAGLVAAGGHGRGGAATAMFGIRAGLSTSTKAAAPGCVECAAECAKIKAICIEMEESFHRRTAHVTQMHYRLSEEVATMKREAADYRIWLVRTLIGVMVTGTGALLLLALFFSPYVQQAWQSDTIAEVDRRAAARILEAEQSAANQGENKA